KMADKNFYKIKSKLSKFLGLTQESHFRLTDKMIFESFKKIENSQNLSFANAVWLYKDNKNKWERFDVEASKEIENYFKGNSVLAFRPTKGFFENNLDYLIELYPIKSKNEILFCQKNTKTGFKRFIKREIMQKHENNIKESFLEWILTNWKYQKSNISFYETNFMSEEHQKISQKFRRLFKFSFFQFSNLF
ncbi:Poly (ADP-ribose) polymerase, variant 2, partial [Bonamia ostreae]